MQITINLMEGFMKFSLCMIVKNEEKALAKGLDCLKDVMDEIIIVDTGSTDRTKEIASAYTSDIYDYKWCDDFSAARNFAFSKATGDYIYSADADEILDMDNQIKLKNLKQVLLPEVEIVQMIYVTRDKNHPTENFERDYRPKLFKRLRSFTWIEPIHETINLNPVVFDSDIEIIHMPGGSHAGRDLNLFRKVIDGVMADKRFMSDRLNMMYIRELYKAGEVSDLEYSLGYLELLLEEKSAQNDQVVCRQIVAVLMRAYRLKGDGVSLLKLCLKPEATSANAEMCMELGQYFMDNNDYDEAAEWFYRASNEAESEIDINSSGESALKWYVKAKQRL
jgi:glycosyltransferase involved in cell wall biosynthesis